MMKYNIFVLLIAGLVIACSSPSSAKKITIKPVLSQTDDPFDGVSFIEVGYKTKNQTESSQMYYFDTANFNGLQMDTPDIPFDEKVMIYLKGYPKKSNDPNSPGYYPISSGRSSYMSLSKDDSSVVIPVLFSRINSFTNIYAYNTEPLQATSLKEARIGSTSTVLQNGQVLIVGGASCKTGITNPFEDGAIESVSNTAEIFNPATGEFTLIVSGLNVPRAFHTATLLNDSKVVIAGGINSNGKPTNQVEIFDPVMGSFQLATPLINSRARHTATIIDKSSQTILFVGGESSDQGAQTWEIYSVTDPQNNMSGNLRFPRWNHSAVYVEHGLPTQGDAVYIIGGENDQDTVADIELFNIFDLKTIDSVSFQLASKGQTLCSAIYDPLTKLIFVIGGFLDKEKKQALKSVEGLQIAIKSNPFIQSVGKKTLNFARGGVSAALFPDHSILIAGGFDVDSTTGEYKPVKRSEIIELVYSLNSGTGCASGGDGTDCNAACGNGVCEVGENCRNCNSDCGNCPTNPEIDVLLTDNDLPVSVAQPNIVILNNEYALFVGGIALKDGIFSASKQAMLFNYDNKPIYKD